MTAVDEGDPPVQEDLGGRFVVPGVLSICSFDFSGPISPYVK